MSFSFRLVTHLHAFDRIFSAY